MFDVAKAAVAPLTGIAAVAVGLLFGGAGPSCGAQESVRLPAGVRAVWDMAKAHRETTATRERVCLNGLWRWQPAPSDAAAVPAANWGFFKVPGCWPGITDYLQKDFQTVHAHPRWQKTRLADVTSAWYEREITADAAWAGRRIVLVAEYVNSYAAIYLDGRPAGEIRFPGGEVDLTARCRPGRKHRLSLLVVALPLRGVMLSFNDTNSARQVKGRVARRGLCGDVHLVSMPAGARLAEVAVTTSVRKKEIRCQARLEGLVPDVSYRLHARVAEGERTLREFTGAAFTAGDLEEGRAALTHKWQPDELWDIHTPGHQYELSLSLLDARGKLLDAFHPTRFGFREFWIEGRDFFLNGTRLFLSAVPLDNAQVGAAPASYAGAKESLERLKSFGINFVYTHNYGCEPGSHLSFAEILRAADDVGMLVALSQPHFSAYDWKAPDAEGTNGYAGHAEFYVAVARNHPSVVAYAASHNATGYSEDMNPDRIDGRTRPREVGSDRNAQLALRAEAILQRLDPSRLVYHHSSGNLGAMHTSNFYPNWAPIQELDDWFEPWALHGIKPVFLCEYGAPFGWDWALYRGWYRGRRAFGGAVVPWDLSLAEWNAQFLGDAAFRIGEREKANVRWEARQFRAGKLWHRWDYPTPIGDRRLEAMEPVQSLYTTANWRAYRAWGVSATSPWEHGRFWTLRDGVDRSRRELPVDWNRLQRPGFSADYLDERYERMDLAFERTDWIPTLSGESLLRNNRPLLAYLAGKPARFTSKDHNFLPGETVEKQLIVVNNSRATVTCECTWFLALPRVAKGARQVTVPTGEQERIPLRFDLPVDLPSGAYELRAAVQFSTGETQEDCFVVHVLAPVSPVASGSATGVALFDPKGETGQLLAALGVPFRSVDATADLPAGEVLLIGKGALTVDGPAPDLRRVREGLRVVVFEQTAEALEKRLGFRVAQYGLRQVFPRVPDHALLAGLAPEHLRDWRGEATLLPPRLEYEPNPRSGAPVVRWCGLEVTRVWRCGNRGNVASVLIEKPARGDFLPILDGGFGLQYSPLLEYREGRGLVLFCQMDVTGRTEPEPAAARLVAGILAHVSDPSARTRLAEAPLRTVVYAGDPAGKRALVRAGIPAGDFTGQRLSRDHVLVVGCGGGRRLAARKAAIAEFVRGGGNVLALGLDENEANAFLPAKVSMTEQEHLATDFAPAGAGSLFAGIGPADVYNRDPRILPLVSGGARILGNGVLAQAAAANVVVWQLPPHALLAAPDDVPGPPGARGGTDSRKNPPARQGTEPGAEPASSSSPLEQHPLRRTYRRSSFVVNRLLANLGIRGETPLLARFSAPVARALRESVVRNGDFRLDADGNGMPDSWQFSSGAKAATCALVRASPEGAERSLRIVCPISGEDSKASVMLAQADVPVAEGQWYRIGLRARAEGMDGAGVSLTLQNTATWEALFDPQQFVPGAAWREFTFLVRARTTASSRTRFQIWHGDPGTLWLSGIRMVPCESPTEGRWTSGLYVDAVEEWDDPYRFFRW